MDLGKIYRACKVCKSKIADPFFVTHRCSPNRINEWRDSIVNNSLNRATDGGKETIHVHNLLLELDDELDAANKNILDLLL